MQNFRTKVTKRNVKSRHRDGRVTVHTRFILNYNDPATGKRKTDYFETRKEAEAQQNYLVRNFEYLARKKKTPPTVWEAVQYWLKSREQIIRPNTLRCYRQVAYDYIVGPAFVGSHDQKREYLMTGKSPAGAQLVPMLGRDLRIDELSTAEIRLWFQSILRISTPYVARSAKKHLSSIFRLIEEDFEFRLSRLPSRPGPAYRRKKRLLLTEDQVKLVFEEAQRDKKWGVYYLFPFLTGVRPSEMLGLTWGNVDLARSRILIQGSQDLDGSLKEFTKTDAGMREIPINAVLRICWQNGRRSPPRQWQAAPRLPSAGP